MAAASTNYNYGIMIEKTKGIVVKTTKYSETSLVVKIFTEAFGMRTYLIRGVRKRKSRNSLNLFQPLSILDLVVYETPGRNMQNTKEIKFDYIYSNLLYDIKKSSILIFLNELIYKSIKEEEPNAQLFQYVYHSLIYLDEMDRNFQNFHLVFMLQLSRYLGFSPSDNFTNQLQSFDMQEGDYTVSKIHESLVIQPPYTQLFYSLSKNSTFGADLKITIEERQVLTKKILEYYQIHSPGFMEMKSLDVLSEVFK